MNIIVLEDDFMEREFEVEDLKQAFPQATIYEIKTAGDFLFQLNDLPKIDTIIIMEHFLPLGEVRKDHEEWFGKLRVAFPEVVTDWDHQEAGERLVRYMRKVGIHTPIILYTHSDREFIDHDVLQDSQVQYCYKNDEQHRLVDCINNMISVST